MEIKPRSKRTRARRPPEEQCAPVADLVYTMTAGYPDGGLRVAFQTLSPVQATELVTLTRKADSREGFALSRLDDDERARWEDLVEKGSGKIGHFSEYRKAARMRAAFADLAARARRPSRRPRFEEEGSVRLPAAVFSQLEQHPRPALTIPTIGLLVFVLSMLENGQSLTPHGTIEGTGDAAKLVIDASYGLGARFGEVPRWQKRLAHLDSIGWLKVEEDRRIIRVARGPRALRAANAGRAA